MTIQFTVDTYNTEDPSPEQSRFIGNASHELRNPVTNLKLRLYLLRNQPHLLEKHLTIMEQIVQRMEQLLEDMLDISRYTNQGLQLGCESVALTTLIQQVIDENLPLAETRSIRLYAVESEKPIVLFLDKNRMIQAITNLVTNGLLYTPAGGTVTLSTGLRGTDRGLYALIRVCDTGIGIPVEALPHLFEPFFRVRQTKEKGTGLGLTIARQIIEAHEGYIEVESSPNQGSTFTLLLPMPPTENVLTFPAH